MPLPDKEAVFALCHPATSEWHTNGRDWAFPVEKNEIYNVFQQHDFFSKQNIFSEEMVKNMYRLLHLGVFEQQNLPTWHKGNKCDRNIVLKKYKQIIAKIVLKISVQIQKSCVKKI